MGVSYHKRPTVKGSVHFDSYNKLSYVGSGTSVRDINNPTDVATLVNSVGFDGRSFTFDGVNQYIDLNKVPTTSQETTFEFWYKYTGSSDGMIFSIGNSANNTDYINVFADYASATTHRLSVSRAGGSGGGAWQLKELTPYSENNVWHHGVITKQSGGNSGNQYNVKMYIDGVDTSMQFATDTAVGDDWADSIVLNVSGIGTLYRSGLSNYFNGSIEAVKVYNKALSLSEAQQNYNSQKSRYGS